MTTTTPAQPEALRLADELEDSLESHDGSSLTARCQGIADDAAAELRRLHAQVAALTAAPGVRPSSGRLCYVCGHPAESHPWEADPRGGKRRGNCPTAPAQPAGGAAYAELPEPLSKRPSEENTLVWVADPISSTGVRGVFVDNIKCQWWWSAGVIFRKEADAAALALRMRSAIASNGQAPAGAAEELALVRQTNLAVVQKLQARIDALEAELAASRDSESQAHSYADDLHRQAKYDADNLADACGGYGGERI